MTKKKTKQKKQKVIKAWAIVDEKGKICIKYMGLGMEDPLGIYRFKGQAKYTKQEFFDRDWVGGSLCKIKKVEIKILN